MSWIPAIEHWIVSLATQVPLPAYVFIGEVVEELISPIPSQAILLTAGSIAKAQGLPIAELLLLAILASAAKTATTFLYYVLADKMEDQLMPRFGQYIGISHEQVEAIGKRLDRGGMKEVISLALIRCLPILPSAPVSAICGLLKLSKKNFLLATFLGNIVRGGLVLLTGFLGSDVFRAFLDGQLHPTTLGIALILALIIGFFVWGYRKRYQQGLG